MVRTRAGTFDKADANPLRNLLQTVKGVGSGHMLSTRAGTFDKKEAISEHEKPA